MPSARQPWIIALLLSGLCAAMGIARSATPQGLWYDRQHAGHGLDLHRAGAQWFGTLYSYDAQGAPQWLWLQGPIDGNSATPLTRYTQVDGVLHGLPAGHVQLQPLSGECADRLPRPGARELLQLRFELDGQLRDWCVEPLLPSSQVPASVLSGAWSDPAEPGWGLLAHFYAGNNTTQSYQTVYYHDAQGQPRWAFDQSAWDGFEQSHTWYSLRNECLDCPGLAALAVPVGSGRVRLASTHAQPAMPNQVDLALDFDGSGTGVFRRTRTLRLLSEPRTVAGSASTREGLLEGERSADGSARYLAIPFAAPPVGPRRWQLPASAEARDQILRTRSFGPGCPQVAQQSVFSGAPAAVAEDCLTLNIWAPPAAAGNHLPVMLWIHGGGFVAGSSGQLIGGQPVYDGAALAAHEVVVVSINYRLGPLGFAAIRGVTAAGNLGLRDQLAALQWVQDNIAAFGGNPQQVTVFGESAGAVSVCALLSSPLASGLFQRAIMQSGNCLQTLPTQDAAQVVGDDLLLRVGCAAAPDRLACMQALDAMAIIHAGQGTVGFGREGQNYGPILDGMVLPQSLQQRVASGDAAQLPLLIGVNDDEMTTLLASASLPTTAQAYEARIRSSFPLIAPQVLTRYPLNGYTGPQQAWQDLNDDLAFTCANRRAAAEHAANGNPVYHYALTEIFADATLAPLESFHGADIPLLFGPRAQASAGEALLARQIQRLWTDFAKGSTPVLDNGQPWPLYTAATRLSLRLDHTALDTRFNDYRGDYCGFWERFVRL